MASSCSLDIQRIINYTGCKCRTIERILSDYRQKGQSSKKTLQVHYGDGKGMWCLPASLSVTVTGTESLTALQTKIYVPHSSFYPFFYGVHILNYLRTKFWKNYIFLSCGCPRSSWNLPPTSMHHFQTVSVFNQIAYFKLGRTSTHQYNSRKQIFIALHEVVPKKVHFELGHRRLQCVTKCDHHHLHCKLQWWCTITICVTSMSHLCHTCETWDMQFLIHNSVRQPK